MFFSLDLRFFGGFGLGLKVVTVAKSSRNILYWLQLGILTFFGRSTVGEKGLKAREHR